MFYNKRVVRCFLINCLALVVLILGLRLTLGGLAVPPFLANPKEDILVFRMLLYVFFGLLLVVLSFLLMMNSLNVFVAKNTFPIIFIYFHSFFYEEVDGRKMQNLIYNSTFDDSIFVRLVYFLIGVLIYGLVSFLDENSKKNL